MHSSFSTFCLTTVLAFSMLCVSAQSDEINGVINAYAKVESIDFTNDRIQISTTTDFFDCDKILLIQMKGVEIDLTNTSDFGNILDYGSAGHYEFNHIDSIDGNWLFMKEPIERTYDVDAAVQIVKVPIYQSPVVVSNNLTCKSWDGNTGGILAFECKSSLELSGNIDVSGRGFESYGLVPADDDCTASAYYYAAGNGKGARKGEGVFDLPNDYLLGRGANANGGGGGNMHNSGGGGGANYGRGGDGGFEWEFCADANQPNGGIGGYSLSYSNSENRIFMGGAGGTGHSNNEVGAIGGAGAGIVIIKAEEIIGTGGQINAQGVDVATADNDGGGGGGAGGTVLLDVEYSNGDTINIDISGGKGGHVNWFNCHGPGGGGSGGLLWYSNTDLANNIHFINEAGLAGLVTDTGAPCYNENYGATNGEAGGILNQLDLVISGDPHPELTIEASTPLCFGDLLSLNAVDPGLPYFWSGPNNFESNELNVAIENTTFEDEGVYTFSVMVNECTQLVESIFVEVLGDPFVDLGSDTTLCAGLPVTLDATAYLSDYLWQDGSTDSIFEVSESGTYSVFVTNGCGSWTDFIEVAYLNDCFDYCPIYSPNAMSPNYDDVNDGFRQMTPCLVNDYSLQIFNRWGELVFESDAIDVVWDGRFEGEVVAQGVYVWVARGRLVDDYGVEHVVTERGSLVVLR